jgi:hypothetical protein
MPERYTFGETLLGLEALAALETSLLAAGFAVAVTVEEFLGFHLHVLTATPPTKPTRAERGAALGGR